MSWTIGYDEALDRDVGHLVTAYCDHPGCNAVINRGLAFTCGGEFMGGDHGCGLHFCPEHLTYGDGDHRVCERCAAGERRFDVKGDHPDWMRHKLEHPSWAAWRAENPSDVENLQIALAMLADDLPAFVPADPVFASPAPPQATLRRRAPPAGPATTGPTAPPTGANPGPAPCPCSLVLYRDPLSGDLLEDIGAGDDAVRMMLRFHKQKSVMPVHPAEFARLKRFRSARGELVADRIVLPAVPEDLAGLSRQVEKFMAVLDSIPRGKRARRQVQLRVDTKTLDRLRAAGADVLRHLATITEVQEQ